MSWWNYVQRTAQGDQNNLIARKAGVDPATITRWKSGPGKAENVAKFARAYGRPVLEAFVAAGFLTSEEARVVPTAAPSLDSLDDDDLMDELRARLRRTGGGIRGKAAPMNPAGGSPAPVTDAPRDGGPRGADAEAGRLREAELDDAARPHAQDYAGEDWARLGELRRRNEERKRALFGNEAAPPSRGDLSPEARPDLYADAAAQTRAHTLREDETPDEGA